MLVTGHPPQLLLQCYWRSKAPSSHMSPPDSLQAVSQILRDENQHSLAQPRDGSLLVSLCFSCFLLGVTNANNMHHESRHWSAAAQMGEQHPHGNASPPTNKPQAEGRAEGLHRSSINYFVIPAFSVVSPVALTCHKVYALFCYFTAWNKSRKNCSGRSLHFPSYASHLGEPPQSTAGSAAR